MSVADLITFAAGFAQYDAPHSVAIRRWRVFGLENCQKLHEKHGGWSINTSVWLQLYVLPFDAVFGMRRQAKMHNNEPTVLRSGPQK
jgi:hypothetical protein